jgi:hypothetical protein
MMNLFFSDKKENPLALLGQYSDDEEDEGAADQPNGEPKGSPTDSSAEVIQGLPLSSLAPYSLACSYGLHAAWARPSRPNLVVYIIYLEDSCIATLIKLKPVR